MVHGSMPPLGAFTTRNVSPSTPRDHSHLPSELCSTSGGPLIEPLEVLMRVRRELELGLGG